MRVAYPNLPPLTPNLNFLVKSKSEVKPLSKLTKCLFILFHAVLALDFGFIKFDSRRMAIVLKLFTFLQMTTVFVILLYAFLVTYVNSSATWYFLDICVYYIFGLSLLISKNTYHDLQLDLHSFDLELEVDSDSYKIQYATIFGFLFVIVIRITAFLFYCVIFEEYCDYPDYVKNLYFLVEMGQDLAPLVYSLLFLSVYCRMKKFTAFVKNENNDIITCNYLYKHIVDITERYMRCFNLVLIVALIYVTIDVTLTIYLPFMDDSINAGFTLEMPLAYVLVVQELIMSFGPAFVAGLVSSQVDKLRLALYDRLVKEQKNARDIKRFISYIDARPLRFKIWMVIPLDWSLPVIVVNISVTYLIVMIQFTQKN